MFVFVLLCINCVHSSFAIILKRNRKQVALSLLSCRCIVTINFFLTGPRVGLQCEIDIFPDHAHLLSVVALNACGVYVRPLVCFANLCVHPGLQLSLLGRESWLLYFLFLLFSVLNVMSLYSFLTFSHAAMGWSVVCDCGNHVLTYKMKKTYT